MKRILSISLALAMSALLLTSCGEPSAEDEIYIPIRTGNAVNYNTAHAYVGTLTEKVAIEGSVTTPYHTDLMFTLMSGTIKSIEVHDDQEVSAGDVIAVLDDSELEDEIVIQKIKLDNAKATYETLVSQRASAEDIEFAKINCDIEQMQYDTLIEKREFLTLTAPFDGRILSLGNYRVGSYINKNTPFCSITDSSKVCLTVSDRWGQLQNVSFGTKVDVVQGALFETTGKVIDTITTEAYVRTDPDAPAQRVEITSYVIQCDEDIEFSELGGVEVTFTTIRRDDAVIVPEEAIFEATDSTGLTSNYVNVLLNGIKVQTPVSVGIVTGGRAEIVSGLSGNETLILP